MTGAEEIAVLMVGALLAAGVAGAAGFGDALVASAVWTHAFSPTEAAALVVATGLVIHAVSLAHLGQRLEPRRLAPFVAGGLVGVPLGVVALGRIDPEPYRLTIGALLIAYAALMLILGARRREVRAGGAPLDGGVGAVGGVLGGFAGLSGFLPTIWCGLRGWPRDVQRAVYQPYIALMHLTALAWLAGAGHVDGAFAARLAWCVPAVIAGTWIGHRLYRRIDERAFRRLVLGLLAAAGASLVL